MHEYSIDFIAILIVFRVAFLLAGSALFFRLLRPVFPATLKSSLF